MNIDKEHLEKIHNDFFKKAKYTDYSKIPIQPIAPPVDRIFYIETEYKGSLNHEKI